jgi:hypothetical protein
VVDLVVDNAWCRECSTSYNVVFFVNTDLDLNKTNPLTICRWGCQLVGTGSIPEMFFESEVQHWNKGMEYLIVKLEFQQYELTLLCITFEIISK